MELWIARGKDGYLDLFENKPFYDDKKEYWYDLLELGIEIPSDYFPEVTFENSPMKVELKLINEVVGVAESPLKTFLRVNEFEAGASYRR